MDGSIKIIKGTKSGWPTGSAKRTGGNPMRQQRLVSSVRDIVAWLNSDDFYLPGTLKVIAEQAILYPNAGAWAGADDK